MVYKALLGTNIFWISYIKWYKFYSNNLSVVLGSKQGGTLKLEDWALIQLLNLWVWTFSFTLPTFQVIFLCKQTEEQLGNVLSVWRKLYWLETRSIKQWRRRRASLNKTKSRKNGKGQRNNMIKSKKISLENTRVWDCFRTWKVICIMYLYWNVFQ